MRTPDFLVIGAMKSGTTTLYHDLATQPNVFLPEKEQDFFSQDQAFAASARRRYERAYRAARPHQVCGDISTTYAMLPDLPDVPARVHAILGRDVKIVYLMREPVSRMISHHRHMSCWHGEGKMTGSIDECVDRYPSLVNYSRYAMQIRPWLEVFGREAILLIRFEDYVRQRAATLLRLSHFLGVRCFSDLIVPEVAYNQSEGKPVFTSFWAKTHETSLYRRALRPLLPAGLRSWLGSVLLPSAPPAPPPPSATTVERLLDVFQADSEELRSLFGAGTPSWDFAAVRHKFAVSKRAAAA
ncbi:MAG TPA: sulfotransferase domain-containing protein [Candidatus Anammoximicrobium sp.]|nr:sulfotransferase domain-containing protein [Candidatus Anammoximicrobium sp.]